MTRSELTDIVYEMARIVGKGAKDFSIGATIGIASPAISFCIPSVVRYALSVEKEDINKTIYAGVVASIIPSICAWAIGAASLIEDNPKYIATPIATNTISGMYELVRKAKNNLEERADESEQPR